MFYLGTALMIAAAITTFALGTAECPASYMGIPITMAVCGFALQIGGALATKSQADFRIKMARLQAELDMRMLKALGEDKAEKSEE